MHRCVSGRIAHISGWTHLGRPAPVSGYGVVCCGVSDRRDDLCLSQPGPYIRQSTTDCSVAFVKLQIRLSAVLLLFDSEHAGSTVKGVVANMAADVIPWRIEEVGSTGIEVWLSAVAYGARSVVIVTTTHTPSSTLDRTRVTGQAGGCVAGGVGLLE